ncbi:MAG: type I-E CRISPR-associated endonuclease Cas1 [Gemmatimonadetes bacterium]|jgi:CRISPR-associated protein Cas1|nr:type I-E CRISPR-associated endonuclease Cas1 [Gemmatimonadota bacterium]
MLQIKDRLSFFYVQRGSLTVIDGCLVLTDAEDRTQYEVPARATVCIMVGPGTNVSTEAMRLAAAYGVLITWVGEHGVRCYSAGRPWGDNIEWLEKQVRCYSDPQLSLKVAREMFFRRFGVRMERRSIDQLRGIEGARVRELYKLKAQEYRIPWSGRKYVPGNPLKQTDAPNLALNVANTCLYGLVETAVHAAGMSTALGFIHKGDRLSFVLDIADLYKMEQMVPLAFRLVAQKADGARPWPNLEMDVRRACRDHFKESKLLDRVVNDMTGLIDAGLGS